MNRSQLSYVRPPSTTDRCTVVKLLLADIERAVEDPALAKLLADGWSPIAHIPATEGEERHYLLIVLAPPRAEIGAVLTAVEDGPRFGWATLYAALALVSITSVVVTRLYLYFLG